MPKKVVGDRVIALCIYEQPECIKDYLRPFTHSLALSSKVYRVFDKELPNPLRSETHEQCTHKRE